MRAPSLRPSGKLKTFRKPGAATLLMFVGMCLMLPLAPAVRWAQRRMAARRRTASGSAVSGADGADGVSEPLLADGGTGAADGRSAEAPALTASFLLRQAALVAVPTAFTVVATVRGRPLPAAAACRRCPPPTCAAAAPHPQLSPLLPRTNRPRTRWPSCGCTYRSIKCCAALRLCSQRCWRPPSWAGASLGGTPAACR